MTPRRLLLDAGNTRLKWAVVDGGQWRESGSASYADLSALSRVLAPDMECHIASVVRAQHEDQIAAFLESQSISPTWLTTETQFGDVVNAYSNPRQLGVDRWMGLIAARQRSQKATLVVSIGTAMTVDALSQQGKFLGGLIIPGIAMMQQALQQGTARVTETSGEWHKFPLSTADAVQSGILTALCGAIQLQHTHLADAAWMQPHCILTGGDAEQLLPYLDLPVEQVPALVLEGMEYVTRKKAAQ